MKKQVKTISVILMTLCIILTIFTSGCTVHNSNQPENNRVSPTDPAAEEPAQQALPGDQPLTVSWDDYYPEYDEQTKSKLIEEAKDEIARVYPDVDRSALEGFWEDHDSYAANSPPGIVFYNVDDTSGRYMEIQKIRMKGLEQNIHNNIVTIKVDPVSGNIVSYLIPSRFKPLKEEKRIVTLKESEDRAREFIRNVRGDDFVEESLDDFYLFSVNTDSDTGHGCAIIVFFNKYNGVQYLNDKIYISYDLIQDAVIIFRDELKDPELMKSLTTLSPAPAISEKEAKKILEEKLKESYPDEDLNIQYRVLNGHENSLNWYDQEELVYADQPEPIRLIWYITFNDEEMRKKDSRTTLPAVIDAHTGEIVSLNFRDIRIA